MKISTIKLDVLINEIVTEQIESETPEAVGTSWACLFTSPFPDLVERKYELERKYKENLERELSIINARPDGVILSGYNYFIKKSAVKFVLEHFNIPCPKKYISHSNISDIKLKKTSQDLVSETPYSKKLELHIDPYEADQGIKITVKIDGNIRSDLSRLDQLVGKNKTLENILTHYADKHEPINKKKLIHQLKIDTNINVVVGRCNKKLIKILNFHPDKKLLQCVNNEIVANFTINYKTNADALDKKNTEFNENIHSETKF